MNVGAQPHLSANHRQLLVAPPATERVGGRWRDSLTGAPPAEARDEPATSQSRHLLAETPIKGPMVGALAVCSSSAGVAQRGRKSRG